MAKKVVKRVVKKVAKKEEPKPNSVVKKKVEPQIEKITKKEIKKEAGGKCVVCEGTDIKKSGDNEYSCNNCGSAWMNGATVGDFNKAKVNQHGKSVKKEKKVVKKAEPKSVKEPKVAPKKKVEKKKVNENEAAGRFRVTGAGDGKEIKTDSPRKFAFPTAEKAGIKFEDVWTASAVKLIATGNCKIRGKILTLKLKNPNLKIYKGDKLLHEIK